MLSAKITYCGNRQYKSENNYRYADISIKAITEQRASNLWDNLIQYLNNRLNKNVDAINCPDVEKYNTYVIYNDSICIYDREEYEEIRELFKEWKKVKI